MSDGCCRRRGSLKQAIREARAELAEVNAKLDELQRYTKRKLRLEGLIQEANMLLEEADDALPVEERERRVWEDAQAVLRKASHPLTPREVYEALKSSRPGLSEASGADVVRQSMRRKPKAASLRVRVPGVIHQIGPRQVDARFG